MAGKIEPTQMSSTVRRSLRAGLLGLGLAMSFALATGPASAGGAVVDCKSGGEAAPLELITACGLIIDNTAASRANRAAALVVRADARARTSGGMSQALADLDRAVALDDRNAAAYRLRGEMTRQAG